jgi:uncharacterized protein Yka (UPF0111/DUF47 family)
VKYQRQRLVNLTKLYAELEEKAGEIRNSGTMAFLPAQRAELASLEEQKQQILQQITETKHILNVTLPDEARKAGIPPGWLR